MSVAIRLDGKSAIVTGAGRSLGRAYAIALAAAGACVVVNDVDAESAEQTVTAIREAGGRAISVIAPVGPSATAEALVAAAQEEFGRIDILIANAGVLRDRVLWKMGDDDFDLVTETHLRGSFTCGRAAAIGMREQGEGGRIVLIGSPAGQFGSFGQTNYAAAKAGLVAMARTWSLELAKAEITVNAVIPTALSPMTATIPAYTKVYEDYVETGVIPSEYRRDHALGSAEDVAPLIVWLASDQSAAVTGQAIGVGGDRLTLYSHPAVLKTLDQDGGWSPEQIDAAWREDLADLAQHSGPRVA
ncbi:SDR family NAD(P)-dependent oxidoreductase [Microbacterium murale]|uniref:NAD(P)-dependent dehydrogenase (Short-subunit alcohol dehydrogenase family) n=1 Tax=Microbacterium murale TaxID=1081040 RepID=A0ABU0P8N1_9MICO|nr:SDR family NAD(P)-dependent oxidoreductase [Microbacterium murale]MDQ0643267.1 NAD(P)-dependent dehydrogenase (short-subunit alcohol dehydrogenase family) [Microbacterium murale]